ncbi:MAG: hypothetical protein ACREI2_03320 [Nitrospiraceae bacterium]
MTEPVSSESSVKLGLAVAWPAFWTGVPIKIVLGLLLLAMGVHPWEMPGLALLLLCSVPIDIWALGLCARTVFLDRLHLEPPESVGVTLWWQAALLSAIYQPVAYGVGSQVVGGAKAIAGHILETEVLKGLPVPERISIELVLWGSVATVVLLGLALGWLFLFGYIVRKQVATARPAAGPYQALVRRWDLLRIPADQPLLLTIFTATGVVFVLLFWAVMPVTTPHPHELYMKEPAKVEVFKPAAALQRTEKLIAQAESAVKALEAKAKQGAKGKGKAAGK